MFGRTCDWCGKEIKMHTRYYVAIKTGIRERPIEWSWDVCYRCADTPTVLNKLKRGLFKGASP